jgi:hypothetical protein
VSKTIHVKHPYECGHLYNLICDEGGSFYKDVHGLISLITQCGELNSGVLELGAGWDKRGAILLQDALPGVEYVRDADNFVDVTVPGALLRAWNRKFSCVTGLCYFLNALNSGPDFQPPR